jgi:hypothetical protein
VSRDDGYEEFPEFFPASARNRSTSATNRSFAAINSATNTTNAP